jgi:acetylornithine deacetylase/succinyl-diaminopimelate desuccinylase-like protein
MKNVERILSDLIGIDSQTDRSNSEIISYIRGRYRGFDTQRQKYGNGENLVVRIEGESRESPLLIACHTDTVRTNGNWTTNPLIPRKSNGEIVGLGACDMKGSLACVIDSTQKSNPGRDIYLVFDGSEEDNSQGAKAVMEILPDIHDATVLIPEPTNRTVYLSQNGYFDFYIGGRHIERKLKPVDDAEKERFEAMRAHPEEVRQGFWNPPYYCDNQELIGQIRRADPTLKISNEPFPGWTEAAIFSRYGLAFIFGAGDYAKAHKPNESVRIEDLEHFSGFLKKMTTYK